MRLSLACVWLAALACAAPSSSPAPPPPPPSFVFLLSESLDGRLLRPGSPAKIPHIRALLAGGSVRFDVAYSNNPVCAPSRSSLWSGRAPHKIPHKHNGFSVRGAWNNYEGLDPAMDTLDSLLNASGYGVQLTGKMDTAIGGHTLTCQLTSTSFNIDFPYNITRDGGWNQEDDMCASQGDIAPGGSAGPAGSVFAADWKDIAATAAFAATAPQPLLAYAGTSILHPPYRTNTFWYDTAAEMPPVAPWSPLSAMHPCDLQMVMKRGCAPGEDNATAHAAFYDPKRIARVRRVYLAQLEEWDAMVGTVVAAVTAAGRASSTLFVLAADHGDMQLEHQSFYKMVAYDASSRVPLIFAAPFVNGGAPAVVTQPTQLLDIFPTLLARAGAPVPAYADGYDLAPFLAGASRDASRPAFVVSQNHDEDISMSWFLVANGTHKLIQYGSGEQVPPQLFDLDADADEMVNLAPTAPADVAALDTALRSVIDYPAVALDVARYQKQQMWAWVNRTPDWRNVVASAKVRWQPGWSAAPKRALAALEAYISDGPDGNVTLLACSGALVRE